MASADAWEDAGLVEVLLPSGRRVRGVLPDLADLARRQLIPTDLVAWVMLAADPEWLADPEPEPELDDKVQGYLDQLVVLFVRQVLVAGEWVDHTVDPGRLDRLPRGERHTLELVVSYQLTPMQATARSIATLAGQALEMEDDAGVSRLLPFREGPDRIPAGDDGAPLGGPPVDAARPARRRSVRRGRGARDAADDRPAVGAVEAVEDAAR